MSNCCYIWYELFFFLKQCFLYKLSYGFLKFLFYFFSMDVDFDIMYIFIRSKIFNFCQLSYLIYFYVKDYFNQLVNMWGDEKKELFNVSWNFFFGKQLNCVFI